MFAVDITQSPDTRKFYRTTAMRLASAAGVALGLDGQSAAAAIRTDEVVQWFLSQNGVWEAATIRVYKAALAYFLEVGCRKRPDDRKSRVALDELEQTKGPAPREGGSPRTSARKRKAMTPEEVGAIVKCLATASHRHAPLASGLLRYGVEFGLRPCEWQGAHIEDAFLVVINAKRTNGRGNGETRRFDLATWTEATIAELQTFLDALAAALTSEPWAKIYRAARGQLAVACDRAAATVPSLRGRPIAFYTGRHVAGARAKRAMPPAEVAAFLGHATDRTAQTHYARPRSVRSWGPLATTPDPAQVATVRQTYRERNVGANRPSSPPSP